MDEPGKDIINERFPSNIVSMSCFIDCFGMPDAKVIMEVTGIY